MRRFRVLLRRAVAAAALLMVVLSLAWLVRTWERGDFFRLHHEAEYRLNGVVYTNGWGVDVGSRRGVIGVNVWNGSFEPREPVGWRFAHTRTDATMTWVPPNPIDTQMADYYDLVLDGVQPFLHRQGIAFRLYIANDGSAAYGEKMKPDPTGGIFFKLLVPHWLIAMVAGMIFLLAIQPDWRRHRRRAKGLCPACGYDLRASPDRCPECGWMSRELVEPIEKTPQ